MRGCLLLSLLFLALTRMNSVQASPGTLDPLIGVWMLEAVDVVPGPGEAVDSQEDLKRARADVEKIHPVGGTFLAFEAGGTFEIVRGPGRLSRGSWLNDAENGFQLRLDGVREDAQSVLPYRMHRLEEDRLVLEFRLPPERGGSVRPFLLHFIPSPLPMKTVKGLNP